MARSTGGCSCALPPAPHPTEGPALVLLMLSEPPCPAKPPSPAPPVWLSLLLPGCPPSPLWLAVREGALPAEGAWLSDPALWPCDECDCQPTAPPAPHGSCMRSGRAMPGLFISCSDTAAGAVATHVRSYCEPAVDIWPSVPLALHMLVTQENRAHKTAHPSCHRLTHRPSFWDRCHARHTRSPGPSAELRTHPAIA